MNPRERIARLLSPLLDVALRSRTTVKFFLTIGIFITANHLAYLLRMGEPVKIVDLAKNLIRLSGKELGVDAEIVFTGLRPGEKLHEELIVEGEDVSGTTHPKVMKLIGSEKMPPSWSKQLEELIVCAITGARSCVVEKLDVLVKGYCPDYEFHGVPVPTAENPRTGTLMETTELPQNRDRREPLDPDLPPDSDSPSKSVH